MNILPHKSWHVRTKKNIARVRRDQAQAAEEEREKQQKINIAESESRLNVLRQKTLYGSSDTAENATRDFIGFESGGSQPQTKHVNFFADIENGQYKEKKTNAEYEKEKKNEQEKFEKKIGYLTYLGQDTNEISGKRSWYETLGERKCGESDDAEIVERDLKRKSVDDPLTFINRALKREPKREPRADPENEKDAGRLVVGKSLSDAQKHTKSKKHKRKKKRKRHRSSSSESSSDSSTASISATEQKQQRLQKLREERLQREQAERIRTDRLLGKKPTATETATSGDSQKYPFMKQKYYSQFNPHLAKQNYSFH